MSKARTYNDRKGWQYIWFHARDHMPTRQGWRTEVITEMLQPGTTPLPDFIEGRAKGKYRLQDGRVIKQSIVKKSYTYGQISALGLLLGYMTVRHQYRKDGTRYTIPRVANCALGAKMGSGAIPRDPERRKLLLELAHLNGIELARKLLKEKGVLHRYTGHNKEL